MTKYAAAPTNQWSFHVTYRDFLDDLYLTYLFNPIGYSIIDTNLFGPYVNTELKRRNSLLRHMLKYGLVRVHIRHFDELKGTDLVQGRRDSRLPGFFHTLRSCLQKMDIGAYLDSEGALENARILDELESPVEFVQWWPLHKDGSRIETGISLERLLKRVIDPAFASSIAGRVTDEPLLEATLRDIAEVQEFISQLIEPQRKYHPGASGVRLSSMVKAMAAYHGVARNVKIDSTDDLLKALEAERPDALRIAKKALIVLADRHNKNTADFFRVGYSNPKSTFLTNIVAVGDQDDGEGGSHSDVISVPVSAPNLSQFQRMPISELDEVLRECGFSDYVSAFQSWNALPNEKNVQGVVRALKQLEQKLRRKYATEVGQQYKASFWHGLRRTAWNTLVLCHIEAHGDPFGTFIGVGREVVRSLPEPIKTFAIEAGTGAPMKGILKAGVQVFGERKYEQFALSRDGNNSRYGFATLHRNLARN